MDPTTYKVFAYLLPLVSGFFAIWWPAGLQIPILLSGFFAVSQNMLFRQAWFRNMCDIQPLGVMRDAQKAMGVNRGPAVAKPKPKGIVESLKTAGSDIVGRGKTIMAKDADKPVTGRTDSDIKKAKAYDAKMAREAAQRRFEAAQAKLAAEEDRRRRGLR